MLNRRLTIGIVGAGMAGCCAAYFARKAFPEDTRIVVYERERDIGGRVRSVRFADLPVELGATFIHSGNRILADLLKILSLPTKVAEGRDVSKQIRVGIWNGHQFVLKFSGSGPTTVARLALRYGLSLIRLKRAVDNVLARWNHVYELQSRHHAFQTTAELLRGVGLHELMDQTLWDFLRRSQISQQVSSEISDPICRAIFNQSGNINAFAGMVALAGGGVGGGDLISVRGGNYLLCEKLLKSARAHIMTSREVGSVRCDPVSGVVVADRTGKDTFDAVILAMPLETRRIMINDQTTSRGVPVDSVSQMAYVTCVAGRLSPAAFRLSPGAKLPHIVLTTETPDTPFSVINPVGFSTTAGHWVYKVQSREELDDRMIAGLFEQVDDVLRVKWAAYPTLAPSQTQMPFVLNRRLYYVNCMESVASTLETEAVASKNAVELVKRELSIH